MRASDFIDRALTIPHVPGRGDWAGADCWGVVELYYEHVLGIGLTDRADIAPGPEGTQVGFDARRGWDDLAGPVDHCVVVMRAGRLKAGHVGVYFGGSVLHSSHRHGCVFQRLNGLQHRVTGYIAKRAEC